MNELKDGYVAVLAMGLLGIAGAGPRFVQRQMLDRLARKATAVMTNVPGPQQPLYLAGARLKRILVWVPQSGDIGVGVSILSYDGGVQFRLITDAALCPIRRKLSTASRRNSSNWCTPCCCCHGTRRPIPTLPSACWLNTEQLAATATHLAQTEAAQQSHESEDGKGDRGTAGRSSGNAPAKYNSDKAARRNASAPHAAAAADGTVAAASPMKKKSAFAAVRAAAREQWTARARCLHGRRALIQGPALGDRFVSTLALHRDDAYLQSCTAVVTRVLDEGVELDRTCSIRSAGPGGRRRRARTCRWHPDSRDRYAQEQGRRRHAR